MAYKVRAIRLKMRRLQRPLCLGQRTPHWGVGEGRGRAFGGACFRLCLYMSYPSRPSRVSLPMETGCSCFARRIHSFMAWPAAALYCPVSWCTVTLSWCKIVRTWRKTAPQILSFSSGTWGAVKFAIFKASFLQKNVFFFFKFSWTVRLFRRFSMSCRARKIGQRLYLKPLCASDNSSAL